MAAAMPRQRMNTTHPSLPVPLTFELSRALVDKIHRCRVRLGLKSVSAVVRHALDRFDFAAFAAPRRDQLQVSVRLSAPQKRTLRREARTRKVSAGELLRAAIEALPAERPAVSARKRRRR